MRGYGLDSGGGGVTPAVLARIEILENNEYKVWYSAEISAATGTITKPTGSTILLDQLPSGADAYVSTISNGQPTGNFPQTAGGAFVDVASFNASGAYTLSGTPSAYPVALIYVLKIDAKDWSNLVLDDIIDVGDYNTAQLGAPLGNSQVVETNASGKLISAAKGTAYNKNFGTTAGTVAEGNRAANTFSGYQGYYISAGFSTAFNPADSTTYFFGTRTVAPATTGGVRRIPLSAGTAYHVLLWISNGGTLGSNEDVSFYLRINDTTDVTISTTVKTNIAEQVLSFTITDTAVVAGDYAEIKMVTPAYATNPTTVIINGAILMK